MLGNDRIVSCLAIAAKAVFFDSKGKRRGALERSVYEKIMYLGISFRLGVVDPNSGTNNGWLDRRQRISKSGEMYGQHEREAGSISPV
jgi:hypothetical protein